MKKRRDKSEILFGIILPVFIFLGFQTIAINAFSGTPCRIELAENWKLMSSKNLQAEGASISVASFQDDKWYPIRRMPATVLQILQEDGLYPNLYFGKNMREKVPQDLYKQDWWYRTTFNAPTSGFYTIEFPGINYRAGIWLNGNKVALIQV
jgi:exo-1,4-beta-D-glucosaminidase